MLKRLSTALILGVLAVAGGCLDRPVTPQEPATSNVYVDLYRQSRVDKIDLLILIDNSLSMADKQAFLARAVPTLVGRLVTPICLDAAGNPTESSVQNGSCPAGSAPEFPPLEDIHVGVITSSLGANGGDVCRGTAGEPGDDDDHGFLIGYPGVRPSVPLESWNGMGFLAWDPGQRRNLPPGDSDPATLIAELQDQVRATGESGCGYEASLEAWYRFLIDPEPPAEVSYDPVTRTTVAGAVSQEILAQRGAFLRPDSLLAVIMLTDENDCSIVDYGQGWLVGLQRLPEDASTSARLPRATTACDRDPNDPCCTSCGTTEPALGWGACGPPSADPNCQLAPSTSIEDNLNLRCFDQKRRFGFDLLHPVDRYVRGLTEPWIENRAGEVVQNPIFASVRGAPVRDRSLVFLAGIVGVPWQDIADEASLQGAGLRYLSSEEMDAEGRWDLILGAPGGRPGDGLMFETPLDRTTVTPPFGAHPLTGQPLAPSTSSTPDNAINGHEQRIEDGSDLQYACLFPLDTPRDCSGDTPPPGCDCTEQDQIYNRPLCNGTIQTHAKAYPGVRQLQVLQEVGEVTKNAIVASICPKVLDESDPAYGYNPAVSAIIDRLKGTLGGACLPRELEVNQTTGEVPCALVETTPPTATGCPPCAGLPGRVEPRTPQIRAAVRDELEASGACGSGFCETACTCEIQQLAGSDLDRCQASSTPLTDVQGYCYVDESINPAAVASCQASQRQRLVFSSDVPANNSYLFMACVGKPLGD